MCNSVWKAIKRLATFYHWIIQLNYGREKTEVDARPAQSALPKSKKSYELIRGI